MSKNRSSSSSKLSVDFTELPARLKGVDLAKEADDYRYPDSFENLLRSHKLRKKDRKNVSPSSEVTETATNTYATLPSDFYSAEREPTAAVAAEKWVPVKPVEDKETHFSTEPSDYISDVERKLRGLSFDHEIVVEEIANASPQILHATNAMIPPSPHTASVEEEETEIFSPAERIARSVILEIIDFLPTPSALALNRKQPKPPPDPPVYYTPSEVILHNQPEDLWVSYLGNVYNLTGLVREYEDEPCIRPVLAFAGKDISDWFDETGDIRHHVHPEMGTRVPYLPHGPIPGIRPMVPTTAWTPISGLPWWKDPKYRVGILTERARPIRILNVLTGDECTLTVCKEDTLNRILERLFMFNSHATSYTWKFERRVLDMNKTLAENGIPDERDEFVDAFLPENVYTPALMLYFNDDLIWDQDSDGSI